MPKLEIVLGESIGIPGNKSIFIYADYWDSRITGLMYELMPMYYHQQFNCYEATEADLEYLERRCKEMQVQCHINIPETTENDVNNKPDDVSDTEYHYKTEPLKHQLVGIEFGMNRPRYLLGDDMGLGKTKQVIDIACRKKAELGYKHCLIICGINGLKWNWEEEIKKHSYEKCHILGNRKNRKGKWVVRGNKEKLLDITPHLQDDIYFYITNVETLRNKDISNQLAKLCNDSEIQMIAFDEFHVVNCIDAQQSKGLLKLSAESMIAMTGSPIMNSPLDLYMCLHWLGYERHSYSEFKNHFCRIGGQFNGIIGFKNMEQIQSLLKVMMLRRLKSEVIDLPPKIHKVEYVEMSAAQTEIYNEVLNDIRNQVDLIAKSKNPLANLIRLRQATGHTSIVSSKVSESAKIKRAKEMAAEVIANGHKILMFSNWTKMTDILEKEFAEYNPAIITGATRDRVEQQNKFMNDPSCKIIIGTIGAMGTGLTLTAGDFVFFLDEPWTAASKTQAEDRAHRIGTKSTVTIVTFVTRYTIDERIYEIVKEKGDISEAVIDNLDCTDITALLNYLIS